MEKFKIEDVAKECGLTKRTIRYYEEIGLLSPPERTEGGMRLYTRQHIERLKLIINARDVLGISLHELQQFISVSEELEVYRQSYRQSDKEDEKRQKLLEIESVLKNQLQLINQKLEKIIQIRDDVQQFQTRVQNALAKTNGEEQNH